MQVLRTLILAAVAVAHIPSHAQRTDPVLVTKVTQGDAIHVAAVGRVRLLGIAAPRSGRGLLIGDPFGREAVDRLAGLVAHRWVRLEFESGRSSAHAAYVFLEDGTFVNAVLVREGLARVTGRETSARAMELAEAQAAAQASRRGLWGERDR